MAQWRESLSSLWRSDWIVPVLWVVCLFVLCLFPIVYPLDCSVCKLSTRRWFRQNFQASEQTAWKNGLFFVVLLGSVIILLQITNILWKTELLGNLEFPYAILFLLPPASHLKESTKLQYCFRIHVTITYFVKNFQVEVILIKSLKTITSMPTSLYFACICIWFLAGFSQCVHASLLVGVHCALVRPVPIALQLRSAEASRFMKYTPQKDHLLCSAFILKVTIWQVFIISRSSL